MAAINKPSDINKIWADGGDKVSPSDVKIDLGWEVEVPPRQYFNWLDGKQDQAIAHINQHGIPVWDAVTEYQANKSYVQGSDGEVYLAVQTHTNQNPTTDVTDTYWKIAFAKTTDVAQATETVRGTLEVATQAETDAGVSDTVAITPKKLRWGFSASLASTGYIVFPSWLGGLVIQWLDVNVATSGGTATFPLQFPTACYVAVATDRTGSAVSTRVLGVGIPTTTGVAVVGLDAAGTSTPPGDMYLIAIGK